MQTRSEPLISNGYVLSDAPARLGRLTPTDAALPVRDLWEIYRAQGYVWLKGALDRAAVLAFRRRFFAGFEDMGLLMPGVDPVEGIYAGAGENKDLVTKKLFEAARWASYEAFCLSPRVREFYEEALGGEVYLHKRKIIRFTKPDDVNSTGGHYDLTYLRGGTERVYTSWIPIGDTPVEMGGLVYLEGSDGWGRQMEAEFIAKSTDLSPQERISAYNKHMVAGGWLTKDLPSLAERLDARWLVADYEAGDMMIHNSYMIHAATQNMATDGRMRLSTDIRYQLVADTIDARWGQDWRADDGL